MRDRTGLMNWNVVAITLAATLVCHRHVLAGPILDQHFVPSRNDANGSVDLDAWRAQTVNAGMNGYLVGVDVHGAGAGDLYLDIMSTRATGGSVYADPVDSVLGTIPISGSTLSATSIGWVSVDVRPLALFMNAGTQFGIRLREKSAPGSFTWYGDFLRTGADVIYTRGSTWQPGAGNSGLSFGFRTYVDGRLEPAIQVPEPGATSTLFALASSVLVVLGRLRR
jgi:hypothetical protein